MAHRRRTIVGAAASALIALAMLTSCAPEPTTPPSGPPSGQPIGGASATPSATPTGTPRPASPSPSVSGVVSIPADCRAMLNSSVLAQLGTTPLNDPVFGASGPQPDGSLVCVWGDPGADTTRLTTTITRSARGPALDMLNALANDQGFTCYTPMNGTRCEKTWQNAKYPVTDGRTLFWRDDVLIDTTFSNLAPTGYTDSVVKSIFG